MVRNSSLTHTNFLPLISYYILNPNKKSLIWNDRMQREWSDSESETIRKLKAIYQHYTHALIDNKMLP